MTGKRNAADLTKKEAAYVKLIAFVGVAGAVLTLIGFVGALMWLWINFAPWAVFLIVGLLLVFTMARMMD